MSQPRFALLLFSIAFAYLGLSQVIAQRMDFRDLDNAAQDIRTKKMVSEETLARDRAVINATYPDIKVAYSRKGFGEADVNSAVVTGWKDFRLVRGDREAFNEQAFRTYVNNLGKIRIESEPVAATIEIDATPLENRTNTTKWLPSGTYRIVLSKQGYISEEARLTVVEG